MSALGNVHLVGVDWHTATKLLYTAVLVVGLVALRLVARWIVRLALRGRVHTSARFWARQASTSRRLSSWRSGCCRSGSTTDCTPRRRSAF